MNEMNDDRKDTQPVKTGWFTWKVAFVMEVSRWHNR